MIRKVLREMQKEDWWSAWAEAGRLMAEKRYYP